MSEDCMVRIKGGSPSLEGCVFQSGQKAHCLSCHEPELPRSLLAFTIQNFIDQNFSDSCHPIGSPFGDVGRWFFQTISQLFVSLQAPNSFQLVESLDCFRVLRPLRRSSHYYLLGVLALTIKPYRY